MKKFVFVITPLIVLISAVIVFSNISSSDLKSSPLDIEKLENSIIVKDIEMESDESQDSDISESSEGQIIHDSSIVESLTEITSDPKSIPLDMIDGLKKRDKRWHITKYKIEKNDNLFKIARKFDTDHRMIIKINSIDRPDRLKSGKYIDIPNKKGIYYKIRKGDSVEKISRKYKIEKSIILSHNRIKSDILKSDTTIFLPDAVEKKDLKVAAVTVRKKAATEKEFQVASSGIKFLWPIAGKITSGFGNRKDPFSGRKSFHCGIDISSDVGMPVKAAYDGNVIFSGWKDGYGLVVIVKHRDGYITVYAHNSKNNVNENDVVRKGDIVALTGMTGAVTGAHLHFEVRKYLTPLNPLRMLNRI